MRSSKSSVMSSAAGRRTREVFNRGISYHILPVAATMAGVCVTIITFFHVTRSGGVTLTDELVALDAFLFILSCFLSYLSIRYANDRRELFADNIFFFAMLLMVLAGVMMLFNQ